MNQSPKLARLAARRLLLEKVRAKKARAKEAKKAKKPQKTKPAFERLKLLDAIDTNYLPRDVSVLMCVHNGGEFLRNAIVSILNQTYRAFEFVIVDDGSTDETPNVIAGFNDPRIRYHRLDKQIGLTRALNIGVRLCKYEYIVRQDADDWSNYDRIEKQVRLLKANPNMAIAGSWFAMYDTSGKSSVKKLQPLRTPGCNLLKVNGIAVGGSSMRRSAIIAVGGHDGNFWFAQDRKLSFDLLRAGYTIGAVQETLYHYRTHSENISKPLRPLNAKYKLRADATVGMPKVGISIIGFNRIELTKRCIDALLTHTPQSYSLYLLDNGSTDGTKEYFDELAESRDNVQAFHLEKNVGCPAGRAFLFQQIDNEYVMSLDNDMIVRKGWLPPLVAALDSDPSVAAAVLAYIQVGRGIFRFGGAFASSQKLSGDHIVYQSHGGCGSGELQHHCGGGTLFRRMALNWIHDWKNDWLPTTAEDVYMSPKMRREGYKIVGVSESIAEHVVYDAPNRREYVNTCPRGRDPLRELTDRIREKYGFNPIRNNGWPQRAGARVLLIFPPNPDRKSIPVSIPPPTVPQGLGFLAASLLAHNQRAKIVDYRIENPDIQDVIDEYKPDWVGVYTWSIGWHRTLEFLSELRNATKSPIVVGGPHATLFPDSVPAFVDHVVRGEGEVAILNLVLGRTNERIIQAKRIKNLDRYPFPPWEMFLGKGYAETDTQDFGIVGMAAMNTSRGCPYQCRFCSARRILNSDGGPAWRAFSAKKVLSEVEKLLDLGYRSVFFREDNFTVDENRSIAIADGMKKMGVPWTCETRVNLKRETVLRLGDGGCKGFYIGVESGCQEILDSMRKGTRVEQIEQFFAWCYEAGIKTYASTIFGWPGETDAQAAETEALLKRIKPTKIGRCVFIGLPGSEMAETLQATGDYEHIDTVSSIVYPKGYYERAVKYYRRKPPYHRPTAEVTRSCVTSQSSVDSLCHKAG